MAEASPTARVACVAGLLTEGVRAKEIRRLLSRRLSAERYTHSLGVSQTAALLAVQYGGNPESAELAGLLHDCARELPSGELLGLARFYGLPIDKIECREPMLLHGAVGAALAREQFGVEDRDVLAAIASHITGVPGMSRVQELVFLADFIEPGRTFREAVRVREFSRSDLPRALLAAFDAIIAHVLDGGYLLHPRTVAARNELLLNRDFESERRT